MDNNKQRLNRKVCFRFIELSDGLQYESLDSFFNHYIQGLDPEINYNIKVRLVPSGNKNITSDDVIDIGSKIGLIGNKKGEIIQFLFEP